MKVIHYFLTVAWLAQDMMSTEVRPSQDKTAFQILRVCMHLLTDSILMETFFYIILMETRIDKWSWLRQKRVRILG
jgi:hypothetical protein